MLSTNTNASKEAAKEAAKATVTASLKLFQDMNTWFTTPLGAKLLATEQTMLDLMLARRFGYHLLQLSCADLLLHKQSPMGHKFSFCTDPRPNTCHSAFASPQEIPLGNESVDLVLLHHAIDYSENQHQLLREVSRVLIAGGHVLIVGFNPFSTWGVRHKLQWGKCKAPWHASPLSTLRITDWLKLLDFQVDQIRYGDYSLPVNSPAVIKYSSLLEQLATKLNWPTGSIYIISARKQVTPLTLIQVNRRRLKVNGLGMPIPDSITSVSSTLHSANNEETNK